ncbi:MAG: putative 6-carboxy-5,6,7,8-tetrahydropterin synthase [Promethearchaeota archaeon]|nr:MAG: putative 6-carboxy-5,6,7,8-tetrahydropterin synthase [Candidatus Lokiarchaeota archaeon]
MSYKIIVNESKVKFSACHFLKEHPKCSRLHGHNYYVSVEVSGPLDENYFVIDFMELKNQLKAIVEPLDHYILVPTKAPDISITEEGDSVEILTSNKRYVFPSSDVSFLPLPATTSELLAKHIYVQLKEKYPNIQILVKVGESKSTMATYQE